MILSNNYYLTSAGFGMGVVISEGILKINIFELLKYYFLCLDCSFHFSSIPIFIPFIQISASFKTRTSIIPFLTPYRNKLAKQRYSKHWVWYRLKGSWSLCLVSVRERPTVMLFSYSRLKSSFWPKGIV